MESSGNLFTLFHINRHECENLQCAISIMRKGGRQMKQSSARKKLSDHISGVICQHTHGISNYTGSRPFYDILLICWSGSTLRLLNQYWLFPSTQLRITYTYTYTVSDRSVYTLCAFCLLVKHQTHRNMEAQPGRNNIE